VDIPLVDIPLAEERAAKLAPEELRRRQLAALTAWVLASARSQPVVLAVEDLEWADPTSLDLMQALGERGRTAPLFIIATARPEFRPPWSLRSHHSVISLSPLDRAEVAQMVGELAAPHALSKEVVDRVSERTGGVPLFVEEVTRLLLERGEEDGTRAIPPTLQQSLAARLDRLGEAREVAQIGAVLGRDFTYALLRAVGGIEDPALQSALDRLADADLLLAESAGPQANYRFKHALIQDAAYDSLLKSRRQALHHRAAEILRDEPERAAAEPEVIAHHFTEAGLDDHAIEWWGKAGDQALRRSAFKEAMAHLGKAIAMADEAEREAPGHEAKDPALSERRLRLHTDYGHAAMWLKGFAADEMSAAYARAGQFAGPADEAAPRFVAYYAECLTSFMRGKHRQAHAEAEAFLREAEAEGRPTEAGVGRRVLGFVSLLLGDLQAARKALERTLSDYVHERDRETLFRFGNDTQVSATNFLALTEWHLGELERARQLSEESNRRAAKLGHAASIASALFFKTVLESRRGDITATGLTVEALLALTEELNLKTYTDLGQVYANWVRGKEGDPDAGALGLRPALASYLAQGNKSGAPSFYGLLAELEAMRLDLESALAAVDAGLAIAEDTGEHYTDPYLYRLRGDFLWMRSPGASVPAEEAFQTAIAIANGQGARGYALLASYSVAKLYQSTGRLADAHAVLAAALEGFAPTPEMPEIAEAMLLSARLA
jgi:hypothetical protein